MDVRSGPVYRVVEKWDGVYTGGPVCVSSDGTTIFASCGDAISVLDGRSGAKKGVLEGDGEVIIASASAYPLVVFSTRSNQVHCWLYGDPSTHSHILRPHRAPSTVICVSKGDSYIMVCCSLNTISVHKLGLEKDSRIAIHTHTLHAPDTVTSALVSAEKHILVVGCQSGQCFAFDLTSDRPSRVNLNLRHTAAIVSCAWCSDENSIVVGSRDGTVSVRSIVPSEKDFVSVPVFDPVECVVAWENGFAVGTQKGDVHRFNTENESCGEAINVCSGPVVNLYANSQGGILATTSEHNMTLIGENASIIGYNDCIWDVKWICGGEAAVLAVNSAELRVWNGTGGRGQLVSGHSDMVLCVDASLDGSVVVSGAKDNTVRLWSVGNDEDKGVVVNEIGVGEGHTADVVAVAMCSHSDVSKHTRMFLVSGSEDKTVKIWALPGLSKKGKRKVSDGPMIRVADTVVAHKKSVTDVAISPDDRMIASAGRDKVIRLWKVEWRNDGLSLVAGPICTGHRRSVWSVRFSPTDKVVLSASADSTLRIWSVASGDILKTIDALSVPLCTTFVGGGTHIWTGHADGAVRLWSVNTTECLRSYDEHEGRVWCVDVRKSDGFIATGDDASRLNVWQDWSAECDAEDAAAQNAQIAAQQTLTNAIRDNDLGRAVFGCIDLDQPRRLYNLLEESSDACKELEETVVKELDDKCLVRLLQYVRDWNASFRTYSVAQKVLFTILSSFPEESLVSRVQSVIGDDSAVLFAALRGYTEKHHRRIGRLYESTFIIPRK